MPLRPDLRLAPAALACALVASACSSTLLGRPYPPHGWRDEDLAPGRGCPDLSGTYENRAVELVRVQGFDQDVSPITGPDRHLAAIFTDVERPGQVERVTVASPAPGRLRFVLEAGGERPAQVVEVAERRDFACSGGKATFDDSPAVRRSGGGSIRLARDASGCLVLRARHRDGWAFLLFVPLVEHRSAEWSRYCPPGQGAVAPAAPVVEGEGRP